MTFDDTIASTEARIHATFADGKKKSLTPAEYASYYPKRKKEDKFDYSDFKKVIEPKAIPQVCKGYEEYVKGCG